MPKITNPVPPHVRPFAFHGVKLNWEGGKDWAAGDCPFCGREDKLGVNVEEGMWRCVVCDRKGNVYNFLRELWTASDKTTNGASKEFAEERGLLWADTLTSWGVVQSSITKEWLIPGYGADGGLNQLYKRLWVRGDDRWELRPTPTLPHQMHGVNLHDPRKQTIYLHESWGNALAFWEVARTARRTESGAWEATANPDASMLADANVLAVANCGAVGDSLGKFGPLFADKTVVLMFDSDHAREVDGRVVEGAGFAATKRAADILSRLDKPPREIKWLRWGEAGFDPQRPTGFDVRDLLIGGMK